MNAAAKGWRIENWGTWGWIETALKGIGIAFGFAALSAALPGQPPIVFGGNPELGAVVIIGGYTLFFIGGILLRIMQKEIISIIYTVFALLGHAATLVALLTRPDLTTLPLLLGVFYILGELAKQRFLATTGFTEAGLDSARMRMGVWGVMTGYVLYTVFLLI